MCLLVFAVAPRRGLELLVLANRDERFERATAPLSVWDDGSGIVAGRDLVAGGTWLGVTATGRFAALTNVRDPADLRPHEPGERSRGELVSDFLRGSDAALEHAARVATRRDVRGFNLVVRDESGTLAWCSNRAPDPTELRAGLHAISNARLDTPWPKVVRSKQAVAAAIAAGAVDDDERLFSILADRHRPDDAALPDTGVGLALERELGPIRIELPGYGTRSSTIVRLGRDEIVVTERPLAPEPGRDVRVRLARR